jgi:hypothetical protein
MKSNEYFKALAMSAAGALMLTGCVYRERVVYQNPPPPGAPPAADVEVETVVAPPAPIVEAQPVVPEPGMMWIGGAWYWGGRRWVWEPGHWVHPPHPGARWVPHHWDASRHVFIRGHWR